MVKLIRLCFDDDDDDGVVEGTDWMQLASSLHVSNSLPLAPTDKISVLTNIAVCIIDEIIVLRVVGVRRKNNEAFSYGTDRLALMFIRLGIKWRMEVTFVGIELEIRDSVRSKIYIV